MCIRDRDFTRRPHVLVSSGGFIGVVDEVLHAQGLKRRVLAATTHFSALAFLLQGGEALATLPTHAARGLAAVAGLRLLPCPIAMPGYAIEMGWRADALRDEAVAVARRCLLEDVYKRQVDNKLPIHDSVMAWVAFTLTMYAGITMVSNAPFFSGKSFALGRSVPFWGILLVVAVFVFCLLYTSRCV